jgi:TPR repeat protein
VTFALAETYDPNMLSAWGSRGVTSDVVRAKALYRKALELGVTKANMRLEALPFTPPAPADGVVPEAVVLRPAH